MNNIDNIASGQNRLQSTGLHSANIGEQNEATTNTADSFAPTKADSEATVLREELEALKQMKAEMTASQQGQEENRPMTLDEEIAKLKKESQELNKMKAKKNKPLSPDEELAVLTKEFKELKKMVELKKLKEEVGSLKNELGMESPSQKGGKSSGSDDLMDLIPGVAGFAVNIMDKNPELKNSDNEFASQIYQTLHTLANGEQVPDSENNIPANELNEANGEKIAGETVIAEKVENNKENQAKSNNGISSDSSDSQKNSSFTDKTMIKLGKYITGKLIK
ncbi:MAG: hypothetical protein K8T10_21405 [Candidatus Eremiobacteraeota bacterium]|nr:hypothetical protein [Candidatus Eremiobacteraeota bacterium]